MASRRRGKARGGSLRFGGLPEGVQMKVLVTGHNGYIGSVMVSVLRHAHFEVVGLDCDLFHGCDFGRIQEAIPSVDVDLRDVEVTDLFSFDAVVHLATLPEASSTDLDATVFAEINEVATLRLAECCKRAGVSRFVYASSCGVYGRTGDEWLDEASPTAPPTPYTQGKVRCEQALASLVDGTFTAVVLRNANVYGVSPRFRTDLIVNNFVAAGVVTGRVLLRSDGSAWRPVVHIEDLARAYAAVLAAPADLVAGEIFNVSSSDENYRVIEIADAVTEWVPHCTRAVSRYTHDEPSYRVSGAKFAETFPDYSFRWTLVEGIRQLRNAMCGAGLTPGEWRSDRYRRAMRLQTLIERGGVNGKLRRSRPAVA